MRGSARERRRRGARRGEGGVRRGGRCCSAQGPRNGAQHRPVSGGEAGGTLAAATQRCACGGDSLMPCAAQQRSTDFATSLKWGKKN
ncbi:hypothetical protein ABZP36_022263 [Zizania latifolia]